MSLDAYDIPSAPVGEGEQSGAEGEPVSAPVSGEMVGDIIEAVPDMGEVIPRGTYHFRLAKFSTGWGQAPVDGKVDNQGQLPDEGDVFFGAQPYFQLTWTVQQEPYVGRITTDFCPWVGAEVVTAAGDRNHPHHAKAVEICSDRLWKAKAIMKAASYKPSGSFNFTKFLNENPELKIRLEVVEKKSKNPATGRYDISCPGEYNNRVMRYLPLHG